MCRTYCHLLLFVSLLVKIQQKTYILQKSFQVHSDCLKHDSSLYKTVICCVEHLTLYAVHFRPSGGKTTTAVMKNQSGSTLSCNATTTTQSISGVSAVVPLTKSIRNTTVLLYEEKFVSLNTSVPRDVSSHHFIKNNHRQR